VNFGFMNVAPGCISLPDFDEHIGQRSARIVHHTARHFDPFANWLAVDAGVFGQVIIKLT
jgi:hypothetical protein